MTLRRKAWTKDFKVLRLSSILKKAEEFLWVIIYLTFLYSGVFVLSNKWTKKLVLVIFGFGDRVTFPKRIAILKTSLDEEKRKQIIQKLDTANDPRAVPVLIEILNDKSVTLRVAAIKALGNMGDRSATPVLESLQDDKESSHISNSSEIQDYIKEAIENINRGVRKPRDLDPDDFLAENAI